MNDTIYRQAAIDALMERFKRVPTNAIIAKDTIENLPSAQPNVPDTNVGEIISILSDIRSKYNCLDAAERPYYHALSEAINALSEQPEIIRCKDCKYKNVYRFPPEYDERDYCEKHEKVTDGANFCSYAERRTDDLQ